METEKKIVLRKANMEDAEILFQWKNDPDTIANSITKRGVTKEEHIEWLQKAIENPKRKLFILEVEEVPAGQLRLDITEMKQEQTELSQNDEIRNAMTAEISYGLAADYRGKGLGRVLLEQAERQADILGLRELTAEVLLHNVASQKLFRSLGFEEKQIGELYLYTKSYES